MRSCLASRRSVSGWGHVTHGARALLPNELKSSGRVPGKGAVARQLSNTVRLAHTSSHGRANACRRRLAAKAKPRPQGRASSFIFHLASFYFSFGASSSPTNRALRPHHQPHPDLSLLLPHHHPHRRHPRSLAAIPVHRRRHRHQPLLRSPAPVSRLPFLQS